MCCGSKLFWVFMHVCVCVGGVLVHVYVGVFVRVDVCVCGGVWVYVFVWVCVRMCMCMHVCVCDPGGMGEYRGGDPSIILSTCLFVYITWKHVLKNALHITYMTVL